MNNPRDEGVLTMKESIEKTPRLFAKSIVVSVLFCVSNVLTADFQSGMEVVSESMSYSLVHDGGSEKCQALRLDMDGSRLTITTYESDCMQGVVSDESDGSLVFFDPSIESDSPTCTFDSLFIDGNDNIRIVAGNGCYDADLDDDGIPNKEDPFPEVHEPNKCSAADEYLPQKKFVYGERYSCRASRSISTNDQAIEVGDGADVLYMAPSIIILGGFKVNNGGVFRAVGRDAGSIAP